MKALVTGSTGFIGSHLVEKLLQRNYQVRCLMRKTTRLENLGGLAVEFVQADFDDMQSLRTAVEGVEYVFHIGGVTKSKDQEGYFRGNYLTTKNLLAAAVESGSNIRRFTLASSLTAVGPGPTLSLSMKPHRIIRLQHMARAKWKRRRNALPSPPTYRSRS